MSIQHPPILPDIEKILTDYLICPDRLPIHEYERNQSFWSRKSDVQQLFDCNKCLTHGMALKVLRDFNTGKITEYYEVSTNEVNVNAKNSMSLHRTPAPRATGVRGDFTYFPFWPGGFPDPLLVEPEVEIETETETESETQINSNTSLCTTPPGFQSGFQFEDNIGDSSSSTSIENNKNNDTAVDLVNLIQTEGNEDILGLWKSEYNILTKEEGEENVDVSTAPSSSIITIDESNIPILNISKCGSNKLNKIDSEWAVMINVQETVDDFKERIPELAYEYPFELDPFQKQAILKLEENCDVFVAAHTSAGKTVVAEYAIALSQKHKTKTIYTSPIKALSNQKYRDFKRTFEDVGLITGDFQINPTGVCLIMTTEILRSMLYCGSEVIRDLEYVIFDEVHYINDAERGHVWEEVLIMLPAHVRIVLLSATVPNTMEFASWLGMTKKRPVYVISTLHRPVPLQHYLYTGNGGRTRDERFLLIDSKDRFLSTGYMSASNALNSRKSNKIQFSYNHKDKMKQEGTALFGLIDHLNRNELLPVVAFTFSRAMCDRMADCLRSLDLTTAKEKSKIYSFYEQCVKRLKQPDQNLPQIVKMKEILKNGIAVHHSGILPIIKEIVEMLFQSGLVKILFATETFAMGVNMPARTVIFNSIVKFDGTEKRYLKPAEYIQMAGRAGRRGKDSTGTVIIRCSNDDLPDIQVFRDIMQGKPQKLESKFRLTYSMLLSLFRAESFSVETMMSHSFCEVEHVTKADQLKLDLEKAEKQLKLQILNDADADAGEHSNFHLLVKFYKIASEYIEIWKQLQPILIKQSIYLKVLIPGRVVLVSYKNHFKKVGILLNTKKEKNKSIYRVLVLCNENENVNVNEEEEMPDNWYRMLSLTQDHIFQPIGMSGGHCVLDIYCIDFILTTKLIKVDCDLVLKDWEKRQIPRFQDDPVGQTCQHAIQELTKLTNDFKVEYLNVDYHVNEIQLSQEIVALKSKQNELTSSLNCTKIANFQHHFSSIFKRKHLEEKVENLKFLLSSRSLSLYPDYLSRVNILKQLKYIDEENRVQMKGRVACEMGMNELLITELVLRNTLTNLQAAEVAALLSTLVYQVRSNDDQSSYLENLPNNLKLGCKEIENIHLEIKKLESLNQVNSFQDLNFGLIEVVYEWARDKPFADIMCLTDVQEGIIVRCIQQLNETLKDVREAAQIIGDPVLKSKMEDASNAIKRDIVFAASLYTQREAANIST